jgi:hypothetical protein
LEPLWETELQIETCPNQSHKLAVGDDYVVAGCHSLPDDVDRIEFTRDLIRLGLLEFAS